MTTAIEDNELNAELQELYLKTKQWISDLDLIHSDLEFLKSLFGRTFSPLIKKDDFETIATVLTKAAKVERDHANLKSKIQNYLHNLEPIIAEFRQNFDLSVVENHSQLEIELNHVLSDYNNVKSIVFDLTKQDLKQVALAHS